MCVDCVVLVVCCLCDCCVLCMCLLGLWIVCRCGSCVVGVL